MLSSLQNGYMLQARGNITRQLYWICLNLQQNEVSWGSVSVFVVNLEHIYLIYLGFLLLGFSVYLSVG